MSMVNNGGREHSIEAIFFRNSELSSSHCARKEQQVLDLLGFLNIEKGNTFKVAFVYSYL